MWPTREYLEVWLRECVEKRFRVASLVFGRTWTPAGYFDGPPARLGPPESELHPKCFAVRLPVISSHTLSHILTASLGGRVALEQAAPC
jgi:hypothetical protein